MKRKEFIMKCGLGCAGVLTGMALLEGCAGPRYVTALLNNSHLEVPLNAFAIEKDNSTTFRKYVVVQHDDLQYPITVFRINEENYSAVYMKCTHQGTELQVFGDRLQCPAHGSEFTSDGMVKNGPADANLRSFPVTTDQGMLKIDLSA